MTDIASLIAQARELAAKATPGPYDVLYTEDQSPEEIAAEILAMIRKGGMQWHWVSSRIVFGDDTQATTVCETGNGPTSEANAHFIAFARNSILTLADECEQWQRVARVQDEKSHKWLEQNNALRGENKRLQRKFDKESVAAVMFRTQSKAERDALSSELDHIKNLHRIASAAAAFQQSENAKLRAEIAHIKKFGYSLDETPREELSTLRAENFALYKAAATLACVEDYSDEEGRISQVWYELARDAIAALPPRKDPG